MYKKVLIPMDKSKEAEGVFPHIKDQMAPDGEVILLHVIPPGKTQNFGGHTVLGVQQEENQRAEANLYMKGATERYGAGENWRQEVVIHESVPEGIVEFAENEGVDLIAMYTHDRKGLAALIHRSVANSVRKKAPIEVQVFKPQELEAV